jgi:hypothetical protein
VAQPDVFGGGLWGDSGGDDSDAALEQYIRAQLCRAQVTL